MPHCPTRAGSNERPKSALHYAVFLLPASGRWRRVSHGAFAICSAAPPEQQLLAATRKVFSGKEDRNILQTDEAGQN
jgi:hypothetical protein